MNERYDLSSLDWILAGFIPDYWRIGNSKEIGVTTDAIVNAVKATVPGSVQKALLDAGVIQDWNVGLNYRLCEWVENRHWIYEAVLPDDWFSKEGIYTLHCLGLDYCGCIRLNGKEIYRFANSHIPHEINLSDHLIESGNRLQIIFECSPRWLGQAGFTSRFIDPKPRFNYTWDWTPRMVQIGIWDDIFLEYAEEPGITSLKIHTDINLDNMQGEISISGSLAKTRNMSLHVELFDENISMRSELYDARIFNAGSLKMFAIPVEPWWPNGLGEQNLYKLVIELINENNRIIDRIEKNIGFRHITWVRCEKSAEGSDPWICVVNGIKIFLFGVNWTPIRTNFADLTYDDYEKRLVCYKNVNMNILRVWGGGILEKECFYDLCDQLGLLVWQEFPLSSSGYDNYPPDDPIAIEIFSEIARSFVTRRRHHASLLLWSGGNELFDDKKGVRKYQWYQPITIAHPLIRRFDEIVKKEDPARRFIATSPSGPRGHSRDPDEIGKGVHWDVHGPWKVQEIHGDFNSYQKYWESDDSLFRSETGCPAPSSAELIRKYKGKYDEFPATIDNPLWKRTAWWIEWNTFIEEKSREPRDLEEYVEWGQQRQADALAVAVSCSRKRFPECGGILIWMGHDCFPCTENTSIIDYEGNPKPAALRIAKIIQEECEGQET